MDLITHALLGAAVAPRQELAWPMSLAGVVPDLWVIPPLAEYVVRKRGRYRNSEFWQWIPRRYDSLTKWSHSLVPLFVAIAIGVGLIRLSPWIFLPWLLHLMIDIPTHERTRTGFLLYPLSDFKILGYRNWYDIPWASVISILALTLVILYRWS